MIDLAKDGGLWTVTLNRPGKANALSIAMLEQLDDIFAAAQDDQNLRALVVTGAGERVFCAGADLGEARSGSSITTNPIWESVSGRLSGLPCLTIAALNGTLAGGGFCLALACDLRIAVPDAKFFYPVLQNGFLPQPSDVKRMNALIGPSRSRLILLAGQKLAAPEAKEFGLIDRIAEAAEFPTLIAELSKAALSGKPEVLTAIKRLADPLLTDEVLRDCFAAVYEGNADAGDRIRTGR